MCGRRYHGPGAAPIAPRELRGQLVRVAPQFNGYRCARAGPRMLEAAS